MTPPLNRGDGEVTLVEPGIGWKSLLNSQKWHFFSATGRSLCGRWMTFGREGEFGNDDSPDNCAACRRAVKKLRAKDSSK